MWGRGLGGPSVLLTPAPGCRPRGWHPPDPLPLPSGHPLPARLLWGGGGGTPPYTHTNPWGPLLLLGAAMGPGEGTLLPAPSPSSQGGQRDPRPYFPISLWVLITPSAGEVPAQLGHSVWVCERLAGPPKNAGGGSSLGRPFLELTVV